MYFVSMKLWLKILLKLAYQADKVIYIATKDIINHRRFCLNSIKETVFKYNISWIA